MNNKSFYSVGLSISILFIAALGFTNAQLNRHPASMDEQLTLEIQTLKVQPKLKITRSDSVMLNLTVDRQHSFDITPRLHVGVGEELTLNTKIVIDPKWLRDGNLEFKIELVKLGLLKSVLFRCAQVAKSAEEFNRSFQCSIPGLEDQPALIYSLKKVRGDSPLAAKD